MAERIELATFDINVDELQKNIDKVSKSMEDLKKKQLDLIKQGKATDKAFHETVIALKELTSQYKTLVSVMESFTGVTADLSTTTATNVQVIQNDSAAMADMAQAVQQANNAMQQQSQTVNEVTDAISQNASAIEETGEAIQDSGDDMLKLIEPAKLLLQAINEIKEEQAELAREGLKTSDQYAQNAITVRELQKQYNKQLKEVDALIAKNERLASVEQRAEEALAMEVNTVTEAREQIKLLIAARNDVNANTEEGQALIQRLNAQVDANTAFVKENASEMERQKMTIGDYANQIKEALGGLDLFGGKLDGLKQVASSFLPTLTGLKDELKAGFDGLKNAAAGTEQLAGSQKIAAIASNVLSNSMKLLKVALVGTGIGVIVVLLGSLVAYLQSSEAASNKLGKVLGTLGGIVSRLLKYLEPLGEFVLDVLIKGFEQLGVAATKTIELLAAGLEMLGFDNAAQGMRDFNSEMEKAAKNAEHLTKLEQSLTEAQRKQGVLQLKYQQDAEKLRQIRDDENRSMGERIKANEDLAKLLKEQLAVEQRIAAQALEVANLRIAQEGATAKNLDAQAEAMKAMLEISERITGQESEQLTNRVALQKEAADKAKEAAEQAKARAEARVKQMQDELELYKLQDATRAKSLEEQLAQEEDFAQRQQEILEFQLKKRLITQTEFNIEMANLVNDLAERRAEIAQKNLEYELSRIEDQSELELALTKAKGLARVEEELRQAQILADARAQFEKKRFEQQLIDAETYRDNAIKIEQQLQLKKIELQKQTDDLLKERSAQNAEFARERDMLALEARFANEWEIRELQIKQNREREIEEARRTYTDQVMLDQALININQQSKNAELQLEKEKNQAIWQSRADLAGALSQLLGEETIAGKAAAIAQATINTYLGVTKALATLPPPASWIAAATTLAQGLSTVGKITGVIGGDTSINVPSAPADNAPPATQVVPLQVIPPFAKGGRVTTGIPIKRSNGDNVLITAKKGEVFLNDRQQAALGGAATFRSLGIPGFATGGLVGGSSSLPTIQNSLFQQMDRTLAKTIGDAVRQGSKDGSQAGTTQGIENATTSQLISRLASS